MRRAVAGGLVVGLAVAAVSAANAGSASASAPLLAQSVGRFVDGTVGNNPIEQLADVHDARATAPGTQSVQNPLDATLLSKLELPLTGALQLPGPDAIQLGVANQVAVAKSDGYSYGASGAVLNSGGVSVGGNNNAFPANATLDLSAATLAKLLPLPPVAIPGLGSLDALGGVKLNLGAVAALAQTKAGGAAVTPSYGIAGLNLQLGSPLLGTLLSTLTTQGTAVTDLLKPIVALLGATLPPDCDLTFQQVPGTISLDNGAVVIDASTGSLTVDLAALLKTLHLDLNTLPANTDLLGYLLGNLPDILSKGLEGVLNGVITPLQDAFTKCLPALGPLSATLGALLTALSNGQATIEGLVNSVSDALGDAGSTGLGALTDALKKVIDIGVNVESGPGKQADNTKYPFTSALAATPNQDTDVVTNQTLVRAIEIDLIGDPLAVVALANAAAGPSSTAPGGPSGSSTVPGTSLPPNSAVPNGVPAGMADKSSSTTLPLVLLLMGLVLGGGGIALWRVRGRQQH